MGKLSKKRPAVRLAQKPRQKFIMNFGDIQWRFDIVKALELVRGRLPNETFDVRSYKQAFAEGIVRINRNYLENNKINLERPIIAGTLPSSRIQVIDGNHRIMAALRAGVSHLPMIVLTAEETELIRTVHFTPATRYRL